MASHLGTKYACFSCGAKFYDLNRPAPVCPKCGVDQREMPADAKPEKKRAKPAARREEEIEEVSEEEEEEVEEEDDE